MKRIFLNFLIFLSTTFYVMAQTPKVNYLLSMPKPTTHVFEVEIIFENVPDEYIEMILPVWRPGRYLIFDFASGVTDFKAFDIDGKTLKWNKIDKCTWKIETKLSQNNTGGIRIKYNVFANEFELRTRGLDYSHGFIDGTSVFMYSEKYRNIPLTLKVDPYESWHVTTGLENLANDPNTFTAHNYDYFVDCPLEIGKQDDFEFEVGGKKHIISISGEAEYSKDTLINDLRKIIEANLNFWEKLPYKKYVFIIHCVPHGGGGTEHINSTIIEIRPEAFEKQNSYQGFLRLISHEFFHTWNVKQVRPRGLTPYDYTKENYTEELWIAEGGTSYYDGLVLLRAGIYNVEDFFDEIAKAVEEDRRRPGNKIQSLAESSFDSWVKFWKRTPQSYNSESDYYAKGADVSLILDFEIRHLTENSSSLDDVFREMFKKFPLGSAGYTNDDFMKTCEEICGSSFQKFFDEYVYGTKEIEWEKYLSYAGLKLVSKDSTVKPVVGLIVGQSGNKVIVQNVISGSLAEDAGIESGDEIIAFGGSRVNKEDLEKKLEEMQSDDKVKVVVFREDNLKEFTLSLRNKKVPNYEVVKVEEPTDLQKSIYENWLNAKW